MEKHSSDDMNNGPVYSSAFLDAVLSAMTDYVYAFNRERRFVYANKTMQALFGDINIIGKTFQELQYPPDLSAKLNSDIDLVFQTGEIAEDEVFYTSPTGKSAWFNYSWSPMPGADGSTAFVIGVSRDMTERHELENRLRESEQRFSGLMEALPVGIGIFNKDGQYTLLNKEMERFLPEQKMPSLDEKAGERWQAWDENGNVLDRQQYPGTKALRGETSFPGIEMLYTPPHGEKIWTRVAAAPIKDPNGNIWAQVCMVTDINNQKQMEVALRESEENYRARLEAEVRDRTSEQKKVQDLLQATMDSSLEMIQVFKAERNEQGEIVDFTWVLNNRTAEEFYGNVIGKSLLALNPGVISAGIFDRFKQVVETGLSNRCEHHYAHEQFDGWFYQSAVKLEDGVATTTTDITERKKAEQQLVQMGTEQQQEIFRVSLQSLEEERRRISESLHNGLGQVLYGVKISLSGLTQQQSEADFHKTKTYTNQLLSEAISESRRISHELMPATLEEFGLNAAVQDICEQLRGDVKFTCKVKGLKGRLERYLELAIYRTVQELMTNIVKHAEATEATIDIGINEKEIKIKVADNGRGITVTKGQKPGIGLASIRSKINLLNGRFEINGVKGKGTQVEIAIPIEKNQTQGAGQQAGRL